MNKQLCPGLLTLSTAQPLVPPDGLRALPGRVVRTAVAACLLAGIVAGTTGCSEDGPELAPVEGTITLDGDPLPLAMIEFQPQKGSPSYGETDNDGHFELIYSRTRNGARIGTHRIRINTAGEIEDPETRETRVVRERVPEKYNLKTTLEREVKPGNNEFTFELTSE